MKGVLFTALWALAGLGCSPPQLQGSLSVLLDLTYKTSELSVVNDQASLSFLRPITGDFAADAGPAGEDLVLRVVTTLSGQAVTAKTSFNLADVLPNGSQRGQVSRNVLNDPTQSFPLIDRGTFVVYQNPASGQYINGYFSVTFQEGIAEASGRTVYANFTAKVL